MFKRKDIIIYASVLLLFGAAYIITAIIRLHRPEGTYARVSVDGRIIADYPLSEDFETVIDGYSDGNLRLVIKNGAADVTSSSCPDKICVKHRAISRAGECIICMPNRVVVEIISDNGHQEIDAVS